MRVPDTNALKTERWQLLEAGLLSGMRAIELRAQRAELELLEAAQLAARREALLELVEDQELHRRVEQGGVLELEVLRAGHQGQVRLDVVAVDRLDRVVEEVVENQDVRAAVVLGVLAAEDEGVVAVVGALDGLDADRVVAARVDAGSPYAATIVASPFRSLRSTGASFSSTSTHFSSPKNGSSLTAGNAAAVHRPLTVPAASVNSPSLIRHTIG